MGFVLVLVLVLDKLLDKRQVCVRHIGHACPISSEGNQIPRVVIKRVHIEMGGWVGVRAGM